PSFPTRRSSDLGHLVARVGQDPADVVRADEPGPTGDELLHVNSWADVVGRRTPVRSRTGRLTGEPLWQPGAGAHTPRTAGAPRRSGLRPPGGRGRGR